MEIEKGMDMTNGSADASTGNMKSADVRTVRYYSENAPDVALRYEGAEFDESRFAVLKRFIYAPGAGLSPVLLDVGCGSGRDLSCWQKAGCDCYGVDACPDMVLQAQALHPELGDRITCDALPTLPRTPSGAFDAVLCSAVLMHLDKAAIAESARTFKRLLRPSGRLVISIPLRGPEVDSEQRSRKDGRLFTDITAAELEACLVPCGFAGHGRCDSGDSLGRDERSWTTLLYSLT